MNKSIIIILLITVLDAIGIGLIMPVLPTLLNEFISENSLATHYGVLLALYATMQVIFAPILGRLSDKYGRKPILLFSLLGAALDYLLMAFSTTLWMLYIGRIIAGITGATGAVCASAMSDITPAKNRTRYFGFLGGAFGVGLIIGPILGGLLGEISAHTPFICVAILHSVLLLLSLLFFYETQKRETRVTNTCTQIASNSTAGCIKKSLYFWLIAYFIIQLIGQIPATIWVLFTQYRFDWNTTSVGMSLAALGVLHIFFQAVVAGTLAQKWGEKTTIILSISIDMMGCLLLAWVSQVWVILPALICLAAGGMGQPALQGYLSKSIDGNAQGKLQGTLVSLTNISGIIGPLCFAFIYHYSIVYWDGLLWMIGATFYAILLITAYFHQKSEITKKVVF
ncbi:Tet(H)/Tet(J) family tetracycline efflux MFS transporter [Proteus vulgaris]|jgi:DHA1 family tetracycline resistance protein-like MFS transporter|uniref:Tetracycline resistance protein (MFS-family transporter) n=1 Tax=Proteus vulgaris TaxID=585 RepID=A0A379FAX5_PROVU|nr:MULTISPECIES: Tet(H)/Tet(J) family tetracycline efflux MFS transporter [Proteus]NBN59289.1 Tet(H)/Tet(J) family tetracycline efflux MFS transporter [Proteus sp. G2639]RNT24126.1 Tet(H)/Tet(J) family tetracycline efflux MFS transporter [Proteus mirabilis]MBG5986173.1 Tet(H)/Tet(J) family tetracycline efflux MFS transporter [Proteus vulgaris]MCH4255359.1 Tet(H)/Tet(J) family tetracycline efflux MFS transporter [Proteus vulgaris]MDM3564469.1 Tet(H)/Tet(J) family tetracycline efflux MFS transpo